MRVFVTGATGFIGSHLCRHLVRDGHMVTALVRRNSDRRALQSLNLLCTEGDITDAESINRVIKDHDAVIHAAAIGGVGSSIDQERVNVEGTRNVVNACKQNFVQQLVHISSVAAVGISDDPNCPANENFVFNLGRSGLHYNISKRRAEEIVLAADGLNAVVVNPSWIFGTFGDYYRGGEIIERVRSRKVVPFFRGGISPVHVDDVANGIVSALARGRSGQRYILGGENVTYRQIAETVAIQLGCSPHFVPIPFFVTALTAATLESIGKLTGRLPGFTLKAHDYVNHFHFYDSRKANEELGYNPRSFKEIVEEYFSRTNN